MISEVRFAVGDADAGLRERLDEEISAFNAAVTGHHDGRSLSVAVRGDGGDLLAGLYGWTSKSYPVGKNVTSGALAALVRSLRCQPPGCQNSSWTWPSPRAVG
jgi:hypothetical protein